MSKEKNVPKLRFPGFSEDWKEKKLGDIAEYRRGSFPQPYGNPEWYDDENGYPFIQVCDIEDDFTLKSNVKRRISEKASKMSVMAPEGTILVTLQGSIGKTVITQYEAYIDRTLLLFTGFKEMLNSYYFMQSINRLFNVEKEKADGGIIKTITKETLTKFTIPIPTYEEQTKIANFLSTLDSRISLQSQKVEKLEELKKGYMQKIFSQELRFKREDGSEYGEWEEKKLGEITYQVRNRNTDNKKIPIYSVSNRDGFIPQGEMFGNVDGYERGYKTNTYLVVDKKTFVYNPSRLNVGSIAYNKNVEETLISPMYVCFKTVGTINDKMLYQYMKSKDFIENVKRNTEGSVRESLTYENFSNMTYSFPSDIQEQNKIADFLSSFDKKIEMEKKELEKLQELKKGLLQQMFV